MKKTITTEDGNSYLIKKKIGSGGMADVFLATEEASGVHVAIKALPSGSTSREDTVERFKREGVTSLKLNHPHIINIIALAIEENPPCFVMEFAPGGSLADKIKKDSNGMKESEIIRICRQILEALDYAHNCRIVHRDIKPENILFDRMNNVLVSDFGLARTLDDKTMTREGALLGTPYYNSPELARGQRIYDGRCDLYSLGVMLFEMSTGVLPFDGVDAISVCHRHVFEAPQPPTSIRDDISKPLEKLILKAMEKNGGDRYQSAADMLSDLSLVEQGMDINYDPLPGVIALLNKDQNDEDFPLYEDIDEKQNFIQRFFLGNPSSSPEPAAGLFIGAMIALVMWTGITVLARNTGYTEGARVHLSTVATMSEYAEQRPDMPLSKQPANPTNCGMTTIDTVISENLCNLTNKVEEKRTVLIFPFEDRCNDPSRVRAIEKGLALGMKYHLNNVVPASDIFAWQKKNDVKFSSLFTKSNLTKLKEDFNATHFMTGAVLSSQAKFVEIEFACYLFEGRVNVLRKKETIATEAKALHEITESVERYAKSKLDLLRAG
jgi:serine/threonine protein kinase